MRHLSTSCFPALALLSFAFADTQFNARGIVAMANAGPDTNKSQFFITYAKQPSLDGKYTIFGRVIDGVDSTLDLLERVPVNEKNRPTKEVRLERVRNSLQTASLSWLTIYTGDHPCQPHRRRSQVVYSRTNSQHPNV